MQDSTKLVSIPTNTAAEITDAMNSLETKDITVNVLKTKLKPEMEFIFYFVTNMNELLEDAEITKQDILVLMKYAEKMHFGNQISISQVDIAEDLKIDKSKVSKSVKKLTEKGIFYKKNRSLFMNWKYLAKGNLADFIKAEREAQKVVSQSLELVKS